METLKLAQDLIKTSSGYISAGFNSFVHGWSEPKSSEYGDKNVWYQKLEGYQYAQKMAKENGIAFTYPFKCSLSAGCFPFQYGGSFVCNACGNENVDREWWKIKVEKDGNAYCCHGLDFQDLQSSNNYAFGDTFEEAIDNYRSAILSLNHLSDGKNS